jgi:hypothetical protein
MISAMISGAAALALHSRCACGAAACRLRQAMPMLLVARQRVLSCGRDWPKHGMDPEVSNL